MMLDKMEIELVGGEYAVRFGGVTADQGTYTLDAEGHITLAGMIGPMAASLLLTRGLGGGLGTMSAISGAQTAGLQYAETYGQLREEGKTHAQAWLATAPYALASGLATAFLTAAGGHTGFEAALASKAGTQTAKEAA